MRGLLSKVETSEYEVLETGSLILSQKGGNVKFFINDIIEAHIPRVMGGIDQLNCICAPNAKLRKFDQNIRTSGSFHFFWKPFA